MRECFYCQSDQDSLCFHAPPLGGVVMCQTWNRLCPFLTGGSFFVWPWEPWSDMLEPASTPSDDACLYREQCAGALIAGSHQPSSCLYDCVGVWRPQMDDSHVRRSLLLSFWPLPSPTNFYCNQPLCVYVSVNVCGQFGPPRCLFVFPLECGWCAVSPAKRGDSGWGDTKRTLEIIADRRRERRDRKEYQHGVIPAHLALDA